MELPATEEKIQEETKATIRCIPLDNPTEDGVCVCTLGSLAFKGCYLQSVLIPCLLQKE